MTPLPRDEPRDLAHGDLLIYVTGVVRSWGNCRVVVQDGTPWSVTGELVAGLTVGEVVTLRGMRGGSAVCGAHDVTELRGLGR